MNRNSQTPYKILRHYKSSLQFFAIHKISFSNQISQKVPKMLNATHVQGYSKLLKKAWLNRVKTVQRSPDFLQRYPVFF